MISGADRGPTTAAEQKEEETHGGCQKVGPKVAKFLGHPDVTEIIIDGQGEVSRNHKLSMGCSGKPGSG